MGTVVPASCSVASLLSLRRVASSIASAMKKLSVAPLRPANASARCRVRGGTRALTVTLRVFCMCPPHRPGCTSTSTRKKIGGVLRFCWTDISEKRPNPVGGAGVRLTVVLEGVRCVLETIGCCRVVKLFSKGGGSSRKTTCDDPDARILWCRWKGGSRPKCPCLKHLSR